MKSPLYASLVCLFGLVYIAGECSWNPFFAIKQDGTMLVLMFWWYMMQIQFEDVLINFFKDQELLKTFRFFSRSYAVKMMILVLIKNFTSLVPLIPDVVIQYSIALDLLVCTVYTLYDAEKEDEDDMMLLFWTWWCSIVVWFYMQPSIRLLVSAGLTLQKQFAFVWFMHIQINNKVAWKTKLQLVAVCLVHFAFVYSVSDCVEHALLESAKAKLRLFL
jgi:hypothetical protein